MRKAAYKVVGKPANNKAETNSKILPFLQTHLKVLLKILVIKQLNCNQ